MFESLLFLLATCASAGASPDGKLPSDEGRRFADEQIIWNNPARRGSAAFIPWQVIEKVRPEDMPLSREDQETLLVQRIYRETGIGPSGMRPYPECADPVHFLPRKSKECDRLTLETVVTEWSPTILVVRIVDQLQGWSILYGALVLNTATIEEVVVTQEELKAGEQIRFLTHDGDFMAVGVRWCTHLIAGAHRTSAGDQLLVIGSNEGSSNGLFSFGRYFPIHDGVIHGQPYHDVQDWQGAPLHEFAEWVRSLQGKS